MLHAYTDGACRVSNPGQCSCAFVVYKDGVEIYSGTNFLGPENHTNNYAEYQGLLECLRWAYTVKKTGMLIHCDSLLVVNQVTGVWKISAELEQWATAARALVLQGNHTIKHVRGHQGIVGNERADQLCNQTLDAVCPREKKEKLSCVI